MMYQELLDLFGYIEGQVGVDFDGDYVLVSIDKESATITTPQDNGWNRINIYYPDGSEEELYRR